MVYRNYRGEKIRMRTPFHVATDFIPAISVVSELWCPSKANRDIASGLGIDDIGVYIVGAVERGDILFCETEEGFIVCYTSRAVFKFSRDFWTLVCVYPLKEVKSRDR